MVATWHGAEHDLKRLRDGVQKWCECTFTDDGLPMARCGGHQMLLDQVVLDHMVFVGRDRQLFIAAEWDVGARA